MMTENQPPTTTHLDAKSLGGVSAEEFFAPGAAERIMAWSQMVSAEEACENYRKAVRKLQRHEGNTAKEMQQAADGGVAGFIADNYSD